MDDEITPIRHIVEAPNIALRSFNRPIELAITPIAGKWKTVILRHLSALAVAVRFGDSVG